MRWISTTFLCVFLILFVMLYVFPLVVPYIADLVDIYYGDFSMWGRYMEANFIFSMEKNGNCLSHTCFKKYKLNDEALRKYIELYPVRSPSNIYHVYYEAPDGAKYNFLIESRILLISKSSFFEVSF